MTRTKWMVGLAAAVLCSMPVRAVDEAKEGPVVLVGRDQGVGARVEDLLLTDIDGKANRLSELRDSKEIVIAMTSATCPLARKYAPALRELEAKYRERGVAFVAVNVGAQGGPTRAKSAGGEWKQAGWAGAYVVDREDAIARALGVRSTTEVFVLDRARTLAYRGAVDDQYGLGYELPEAKTRYLVNALEAVLADERPDVEATTAPGCVVKVGERQAAAGAGGVTYHNRVSRIVQNRCVECHRKGENGPFELTTFDDVKANAAMIKKVVGKRTMPPWYAEGNTGHAFKNDMSLADREREDLIAWVDAGSPEGDPADAPVARKFVDGWRIGKPDLVLESPKAQTVPAAGTIRYRYVTVPNDQLEDRWVRAMEVRPSAPEVVHHLLVFITYPKDDPRAKGAMREFAGGLKGYFAGMVPGQGHITFPEGTAKLLPKGCVLVFQIHYTANGTETKDRPRIGFKFAGEKPRYVVKTGAAANNAFQIPAHDPNFEIAASHTFFQPTRLLSVNPHSHVRGKAFRYELIYPDGKTDVILDVPRYQFGWQLEYQFARPIDVPAGTRLKVTGWYDNSKGNPANPNPDKVVKFGEQTWEEMMIGYFTGHLLR